MGLLTGVVPAEALLQIAKDWPLENAEVQQPWTVRGHGGPAGTPALGRLFHGLNARLTRDGADNHPARNLIAEAAYHGLQMPIEPALRVELRRFIALTRIPTVCDTRQARVFGENA